MCNDIFLSEYGDLRVDLDALLTALRPRPHAPRPLLEPDYCSWCEQWIAHDENCPRDQEAAHLAERQSQEVTAHLGCEDIAEELWDQCNALEADIDATAAHMFSVATCEDGWNVIEVDEASVVRLELAEMESADLLRRPRSAAATIAWPIEPVPFCDHDAHTTPHRACRYLIS
jgi:hypothetical protein